MTWTKQYWDVIEQLYWYPKYIGLESIPKSECVFEEELVKIPLRYTNTNGPLYRRTLKSDVYWSYIRRQEETLNHIFNFVFSVVSGKTIGEIFTAVIPINAEDSFQRVGLEVKHRYQLDGNVTTPDGYFIAHSTVLAVELKFEAKTSPDQLAKYIYLMLREEHLQNRKLDLKLIYILSNPPDATLARQLGFQPSELSNKHAQYLIDHTKNNHVRTYLENNLHSFEDALNRLTIIGITWSEFSSLLGCYIEKFGDTLPEQTFKNLISGLVYEIKKHPLSKIK